MTPARARMLLGVPATASSAQVEAAFRRKAWAAHPDRGGSAVEFADLAAARALLVERTRHLPAGAAGSATANGARPPAPAVVVVSDATALRQMVAGALGRWVGRRTGRLRRQPARRRVI